MKLLERETPLQELEAALKEATAGEGRVTLVCGEAGIGKTSLVEQFVRDRRDSVRVLWGTCDSLAQSNQASVTGNLERPASRNAVNTTRLYRSQLGENFDVSLRELTKISKTSQASAPWYRSRFDECFDVSLREYANCHLLSQASVP